MSLIEEDFIRETDEEALMSEETTAHIFAINSQAIDNKGKATVVMQKGRKKQKNKPGLELPAPILLGRD